MPNFAARMCSCCVHRIFHADYLSPQKVHKSLNLNKNKWCTTRTRIADPLITKILLANITVFAAIR